MAQRWVAGRSEQLGRAFAALCDRACSSAQPDQEQRVRWLMVEANLGAQGVEMSRVAPVIEWMNLRSWDDTWDLLARPESSVRSPQAWLIASALAECFGDDNAADHADLLQRVLMLDSIGVADAIEQTRGEHRILLSIEAVLGDEAMAAGERAERCVALTVKAWERLEQAGAAWLAEAAVEAAEQAVEHARTTNNPDLDAILNILSNQLSKWIERFGGPRDRYPDSVAYAEQAVEHARTTNDPWLGAMLSTLSNRLSIWIERFGGPRDRYPDSVAYAEQAVEHARTTN